jgi:hypothetical protein
MALQAAGQFQLKKHKLDGPGLRAGQPDNIIHCRGRRPEELYDSFPVGLILRRFLLFRVFCKRQQSRAVILIA